MNHSEMQARINQEYSKLIVLGSLRRSIYRELRCSVNWKPNQERTEMRRIGEIDSYTTCIRLIDLRIKQAEKRIKHLEARETEK